MTEEYAVAASVASQRTETFYIQSDETLTKKNSIVQDISQKTLRLIVKNRLDLLGKEICLDVSSKNGTMDHYQIVFTSLELSEIYKRCREKNFR